MEKWDLYNVNRERTGKVHIRGNEIPAGLFRLVVHVCIFNSNGQMLIQKRQKTKSGWPDLWDVSVGGHVQTGESTQMAGERETMEELGLQISLQDKRPVITPTFANGFDDMYTLEMDVNLDDLLIQEEEVQEVGWASEKEVLDMIEAGIFIPYHKSIIELLFFLRNHPEIHTD